MKDIETVVRDANGEVLEVGDIVITPGGGAAIISRFYFDRGDYWIAKSDGSRAQPSWEVTKAATLTHDQYVPLARRTMDPDLMGDHPAARKARLAKLALGTLGEAMEVIMTSDGKILEECGDLIWYAEQLQEEVGEPERSEIVDFGIWEWFELVKKAAFQGKGIENLQALADAAIRMAQSCAENRNKTIGEIRLANIRKLIARYPDGFVMGGGER